MAKLINPLGISAFIILWIAVFSGMFMRKLKLKLIHHKIIAGTAAFLSLLHFVLIIYFYYM